MRRIGSASVALVLILSLGVFAAPATAQEGTTVGYKEISSFFNVREAHSNVPQGGWELEFAFGWSDSDDANDELALEHSIKYGYTDNFHIELEVVAPNIDEGGDNGTGEIELKTFYRLFDETADMPALGGFLSARIPTGEGSSGVDGTLGASLTKTLCPRSRLHFYGFVQSANGDIGEEDGDRRSLQWGAGPGVDFQLDDSTMLTLNYFHRSSTEDGDDASNTVQLGSVHELGDWGNTEHEIKLAVDFGVDGRDSTSDIGAKILWDITWN